MNLFDSKIDHLQCIRIAVDRFLKDALTLNRFFFLWEDRRGGKISKTFSAEVNSRRMPRSRTQLSLPPTLTALTGETWHERPHFLKSDTACHERLPTTAAPAKDALHVASRRIASARKRQPPRRAGHAAPASRAGRWSPADERTRLASVSVLAACTLFHTTTGLINFYVDDWTFPFKAMSYSRHCTVIF